MACWNAVAAYQLLRWLSAVLQPVTDITVERPFSPALLSEQRQDVPRTAIAESAANIPGRSEHLRIGAKLDLSALIFKEFPFHAVQQIAQTGRGSMLIARYRHRYIELQLKLWQPIVEVQHCRCHPC